MTKKNEATVAEVLETQDIAGDVSEITLVLTRNDPVKASGVLAIALGTILATLQRDPSEVYPLIEAYHQDALRVITEHIRKTSAKENEQATFDFLEDKKKAN